MTWVPLGGGSMPSCGRQVLVASNTVGFSDQLVLSCPPPLNGTAIKKTIFFGFPSALIKIVDLEYFTTFLELLYFGWAKARRRESFNF